MSNLSLQNSVQLSAFDEFLKPGVDARDVDALFPLLQSAHIIDVLIALFRGGREEVLIRLAVMREIAARAEQPEWTPAQLQNHLSFVEATKLDTVLNRLRSHDLMQWDADRRLYQISASGRMVLSAISGLIRFGQEDDELGFLVAQAAGSGAVGNLSPEHLSHVLAKLTEYEHFFEEAVASGSEFRLKSAQARLAKALPWIEKATTLMQNLAEQGLDDASWQITQKIANQQSRLLRMASVFQMELAKISRQRVMLSDGGLSSSELSAWLRAQTIETLASLGDTFAQTCEPLFMLPDVMMDISDDVLERDIADKKVSIMPPAVEVAEAEAAPFNYPPQLAALTRMLETLSEHTTSAVPLSDVVVGGSFAEATYRYSLLTFLGKQHDDADLAALAAQPFALAHTLDAPLQAVHRNEIAEMTHGQLTKKDANP
ncbi:MAG: hypothetical protein CVU29_02785 [Betaproteobacteria bacterium HGW-Betaproteobacteria-22]|nr:MAG: hypothetical protein CVU29_02785 [Betaproteobacteria bacterium HGW-Betaproteobacteria-22]